MLKAFLINYLIGGKSLEIIKHQGKYSKFVELVTFAELENDLNAEGPFTVFAPTGIFKFIKFNLIFDFIWIVLLLRQCF